MRDPVLRGPKTYRDERNALHRITAVGGLHYIRGNTSPYFSLTGSVDRFERGRWEDDMGGCIHDELLKHWPELAPLAALHLSDINGAPSYAGENGFYFVAGGSFMGAQWLHSHGPRYNEAPTDAERAGMVARHLRITEADAAAIIREWSPRCISPSAYAAAKRDFSAAVCDPMRARWQAEADAARESFGIVIYGDTWPQPERVQC
jgi:hypothetical protein